MAIKEFFDIDIILVVLVNTMGIIISWATTKELLSVLALVVSISYTVWKWRRDHIKHKRKIT